MLQLLAKTHVVSSVDDRARFFAALSAPLTRSLVVSWLNAHSFTVALRDPTLGECLLRSSYLLRDGIGLSLLMRTAGQNPGHNMNGTDLIPEILRAFRGRKIAVFGTEEPHLTRAVKAIEAMGVEVVAQMDGFQPEEAYAARLAETAVDLIVLGMGVPKQEKVASHLERALTTPSVILNGGAILDFLAERFPRAPRIIRNLRMEWLFRLLQEPRRLWGRYIGSLPELIGCAYRIRVEAKGKAWR